MFPKIGTYRLKKGNTPKDSALKFGLFHFYLNDFDNIFVKYVNL